MTVWDNFIRGAPAWLTELEGDAESHRCRRDLIEPLPSRMPDFQWIIHAAGIASPPFYRKYPLKTIDANINGLRNLLDYCVRAGRNAASRSRASCSIPPARSTATRAPMRSPRREDYRGLVSCTGPRACYDESKRFGETLCVVFAQQYGVPTKMARPFNNYGPGLKITDKRVIPDFARDIFAGRDIVMFSDGKPTRTFCYSADSITGYYKVLVKGRAGEPYNIGTEKPEISMGELAEKSDPTPAASCSATAASWCASRIRRPTTWSTTRTAVARTSTRRASTSATTRRSASTKACARSLIWYHHNREAEEA